MKKRLWWLLGAILIAVLLYSGYRAIDILAGYAQGEAVRQDAVRRAVVIADEGLPAAQTEVPESEEVPTQTPLEKPPITVDFDALHKINPEVAGWLYCADTPINDPVVHTDNNTYYLKHLYTGEANRNGTLFIDSRCSPDFSDPNTIIYGHHMKSGAMFACLVEYGNQEYYDAHPVMYLLTPQRNYRLDLFSGYVSESGSQRFFMGSGDETEFESYVAEIKALSDFKPGKCPNDQNRIITMSTCTYDFDEARYILHAFVTEIG